MRRSPHLARAPARALCQATLAVAALTAAGCGASTSGTTTSALEGAALPAGMLAPPFTLEDVHGRPVSLSEHHGGVVVLAFVDSNCAPACVLVAQQIRGALDDLARPVPVLVVSVDPSADTPAHVAAFLRAVGLEGRVRYLVGPANALRQVWRSYHVITPAAGRTAFERAVPVIVIDPAGDERVLYEQEQLTPEALAHDVGILQGRPNPG